MCFKTSTTASKIQHYETEFDIVVQALMDFENNPCLFPSDANCGKEREGEGLGHSLN